MDMRKYIRNVGNVTSGVIISAIIGGLSLPVISRFYTPKHFGVFGQYSYFVLIGGLILTARYDTLLAICKLDRHRRLLLKSVLVFSTVLALFAGACLLAADLLFRFWSVGFLLLALAGAYTTSVFQTYSSWLIATQAYTRLMRLRIGQSITISVVQIAAGIIPGIQWVGLAAGDIASRVLVLRGLLKLRTAVTGHESIRMRAILHVHRSQAVYLTLSSLLSTATLLSPVPIFSRMFDAATSGVFFMAFRLSAIPVSLLGRSMAQVFMGDLGQSSRVALRAAFRRVAALSLALSFVVGGAVWAGGWVVDFFFARSWHGVGQFLRTQSLVCVGQIFMLPLVQVLTILRQQRSMFVWELVRCVAVHACFLLLWKMKLSPLEAAASYSALMFLLYLGLFVVCYVKVYGGGEVRGRTWGGPGGISE